MKFELNTIKTNWKSIQRQLNSFASEPSYVEYGYGKIPERLDNDEFLILKSKEYDLIEMAMQSYSGSNIQYIDTVEEEEEDESIIYWAVIYHQSDDE